MIAMLIWILVANTNDPVISKRFSNVPVEVENEEALTEMGYAYEIIEGDEVSFSIKGKKSIVSNMNSTDFKVVADFSKLWLTDAVPIDVTAKKYEDQLEINLGNNNTMKIRKDETSSISLPVYVSVSGDVADGYYIHSKNATPNLVKVTGPKNLLENAKEIRAEVSVDGISKNITSSTKPILYDSEGKTITSNQITIDSSSIIVSIDLWRTKNVDMKLNYEGTPKNGYVITSFDYEPKIVRIAASDDVYDDFESLYMSPVSLSGKDKNYEEDIAISSDDFPMGVILADNLNSIKVRAKIEKKENHKVTFEKKDLRIKNKPAGYNLSFESSNQYFVNIEGAKSQIDAINIESFQPWIDLSGLEEGTHEVSIHVKEKDGIDINSTSRIWITLSK